MADLEGCELGSCNGVTGAGVICMGAQGGVEPPCNTGNFEITFCSEVSCDAKFRRIEM